MTVNLPDNNQLTGCDGISREIIEVTGATLSDFTTVVRLNIKKLKEKFEHTKDKTILHQCQK